MIPLIIKTEDRRRKTLEEICNLGCDKIFIWGSGHTGERIKDYIRAVGHYSGEFVHVVDDAFYHAGLLNTIPISEFFRGGELNDPIVFGFYNYIIIQEKKKRFQDVFPHLYDFHLTAVNGRRLECEAGTAKAREAEYRRTYDLLGDERSKRVMQLYLNAATAGEFDELFTQCYETPSYFNRITAGLPVDTLIDCGAYDGDSIHDFVNAFPDYRRILAAEPDARNLEKLREREAREAIRDLTIIPKGVGSEETELRFCASGESSACLDESGETVIRVTTLDSIAAQAQCEKDLGNVFVKMDIEGAELDALRGAEKLIREKNPILAVCVYHKEEDLIEIPRYIHETAGAGVYNYFLGFHGLDLAELVFYAIPRALSGK